MGWSCVKTIGDDKLAKRAGAQKVEGKWRRGRMGKNIDRRNWRLLKENVEREK